jgi:hypothetical protein
MTSTYPLGTHGSVARFFAAIICQETHIRKHDCLNREIYIPYAGATVMLLLKMKSLQWEN